MKQVIAVRTGFFDGARRRAGETFSVAKDAKATWFTLDAAAEAEAKAQAKAQAQADAQEKAKAVAAAKAKTDAAAKAKILGI